MDSKYTYKLINEGTGYEIIAVETSEVIRTQYQPYNRIYLPNGSVEENAAAHIDSLLKEEQQALEQLAAEEKKANDWKQMRADIDFLLMLGEG